MINWKTTVAENPMGNRLSYSQMRTYGECGQKYKYYYIDKLREKTRSGALCFGEAFDKATEAVLKNRDIDEKEVFDTAFTNQRINNRAIHVPDCPDIVYAASDFDGDLLTDEDTRFLNAKAAELLPDLYAEVMGDARELVKKCATFKKQRAHRTFRVEEAKYLNLANWISLRRKGHLMLDANRAEILPKITKVVGTQVKVELKNGDGDSLIGYADLVCHWLDDQEPMIIDYKTSSIEYETDSVLTSPQLTIYAHSLGIRKAGYIVFRKGILKNKTKFCVKCGFEGTGSRAKTCTSEDSGSRCGGAWEEKIKPTVDIQIITDIIPERTEDIVINNVDEINKAIKAGVFVRNFNSCQQGYGPCPYLGKCFRDKEEGLERVGSTRS